MVKRIRTRYRLPFICSMSRHSRVFCFVFLFCFLGCFFFVIQKFGCHGPCIIAINTRSRLQLEIWCNIRLYLFLIDDIAKIYFVNAFVGKLNFKEQTWLLNSFFFTWVLKKPIVRKIRNHRTDAGDDESKLAKFIFFTFSII